MSETIATMSEQDVIDYLRTHPEFFERNQELLKELTIPHESGSAISLGERQVQLFREHRDELQHQLNHLIGVARENDQHFEKSKNLLLNLLEVKSLDEVDMVVSEAFRNDPNIDFSNVVLFGDPDDYPVSDVTLLNPGIANERLGNLMNSTSAICGRFKVDQLACLFPANNQEIGSAAVIPLRHGETLGMFCLASKNPDHFDSAMGSLFLSYISDFISRILPDLLIRCKSTKQEPVVPSLLD